MSQDSVDPDHRLDVRDVEGQPFDVIMSGLEDLSPDETLLLVNSFEPEPLYDVLESKGFIYDTTNPDPERWHVEIRHA